MQRTLFPYHALSVLVVLLLDWSVYALNMLTYLREPFVWVSLGALVSGVAVGFTESRIRGAAKGVATTKGMLAAIMVAAPLPLAGSVLFGFAVSWWLIAGAARITNQLNH